MYYVRQTHTSDLVENTAVLSELPKHFTAPDKQQHWYSLSTRKTKKYDLLNAARIMSLMLAVFEYLKYNRVWTEDEIATESSDIKRMLNKILGHGTEKVKPCDIAYANSAFELSIGQLNLLKKDIERRIRQIEKQNEPGQISKEPDAPTGQSF